MALQGRDTMGGFAKGLRVIEAFSAEKPRMSIADAALISGLDRATARRCLLTLSDLGYANYDGKYFSLTPKIMRLGHAYLSATPLPQILQPFLDRLSEEVGQSVSASVLDATDIIYIARASQRRVMSINLTPGSRLPAYCASMGRVLLAALSADDALARLRQRELKRYTQFTKTDPDVLMNEIAHVRENGFAVIDQELELGLCSIAVPLTNERGQVVAAINIGASAANVAADKLADLYLQTMLAVASSIKPLLTTHDIR